MKTFPSGFTAAKNTPAGSRPVWFLALPTAADGSGIVYVSDRVLTVRSAAGASVVTKAWVSDWGALSEGISGRIGEFSVAEFRVHLLNDPTDSDNIVHLIDNHDIETAATTLCCWFEGIGDPAQVMFTGYIRDYTLDNNDAGVDLHLQDATLKSEETVGTVISAALYPSALAADIGKIVPIPFGTVKKVPARCVDAGWVTGLQSACAESATTLYISEFPGDSVVGLTVYVEQEQMLITAVNLSAKSIVVTRGTNGTEAAYHDAGALVIEKKSAPLVFLCGDAPVTSLGPVYARYNGVDIDISSYCSTYTGATGNALSGYAGKAAVTIATTPTLIQSIRLALENGLNLLQGNHNHPAAVSYTTIAFEAHTVEYTSAFKAGVSGASLSWDVLYDGDEATFYCGNTGYISYRHTSVISNSATPIQVRVALLYSVQASGGYPSGQVKIYIKGTLVETWNTGSSNLSKAWRYSGWHTITAWSDLYDEDTRVYVESRSQGYFYECRWQVQTGTPSTYSAASGVALTGDLSLVGNSTASVVAMEALVCDIVNSAADTPKEACDWLLANYGPPGITSVTADNAIHTSAGNLNGCIMEKKTLIYWLNRIAFEFRSRFKFSGLGAKLLYRPDTLSSLQTVVLDEIRTFMRKRSDFDDIVNKIELRYARDWSNSDSEPYASIVSVSDSASQARYGTREKADLFRLDFVTGSALASSIAAYYLARYKGRRWLYEVDLFLDNMELEYADVITMAMGSNPVGVITEAGITPGTTSEPDMIKVTVEV